jgi:arsenical resistance protein ArsH
MSAPLIINGDLNNTSAAREVERIEPDPLYSYRSLAVSEDEDDATIRKKYRPFLLDPETTSGDWISKLELSTVTKLAEADLQSTGERLKVLVLYGSLRQRYGRLVS